jgi:hypothetical protein
MNTSAYFDFDPPVITESSVPVAEYSTSVRNEGVDELLFFPNPADQRTSISSSEAPITMLFITGAGGRMVLIQAAHGIAVDADVQTLRAGAYFMEATLANGHVLRGRSIKN